MLEDFRQLIVPVSTYPHPPGHQAIPL
ncbi:unnamed protein product [Larinioides sclopetarius]|uniref:Uncharacterized protein n=1 Tax=Larinioides sclopetarius TaxID=280406 RepID=A0AAV1Z9K3_9ARAC